ncbi:MAG: amino acid ABC transporter permease [Burkholderiaceae bacterium]|nr:amino acid ABC transporter permease [Burkholderiaceae bacterium]
MITEFSTNHLGILLLAARWTLLVSLLAFVGGTAAGFAVALCRTSRHALLRRASMVYIQIVQGTPVLIVLFLSYYGLSVLGLKLSPMLAATLAMSIYASAYLGEIWRGCIEAVPPGQWEAGESLAMTRWQQLRHVVLPQALRLAIPPTVGFSVQIVKNTSITSIIGVVELTRAGQLINNATFQPFVVFVVVALVYFALCFPLSSAAKRMERNLHVAR